MNTRPAIDTEPPPPVLSVAYNQDFSCFSAALLTGFRVYTSPDCHREKSRELGGGLGCAEMLGRTSYLALVGGGSNPKFAQNKIIIWDESKQRAIITLELRTPVQRIRLTKSHIVAALLNSIHLYKFSAPPEKVKEFETTNNPFGLCCLGNDIVIFPGRTPGQVQVLELATHNVSIIPAHTSALRALSLSSDGTVIATASEQGTLIRLWSVGSGAKIAEFRRGVDAATIFSLALSPSNTFLAATSDKGTLHIFDLPNAATHEPPPERSAPQSHSSRGYNEWAGALEVPNGAAMTPASPEPVSKWGILAKLPLMPRVFSDTYSTATARFEMGEEPELWAANARRDKTSGSGIGIGNSVAPGSGSCLNWNTPIQGVAGGRPPKGVIGWLNDVELLVIGAGRDSRWEKFTVGVAEDGRRCVRREGWKPILE
ncbi:uncharacterized protein K452DRAFT_255000 [Aplosporella prunicola CBS 121167]